MINKINYIKFLLIITITGFSACSEDFIDRTPLTNITAEGYFKKASDFELYVNQFYPMLTSIAHYGFRPYSADANTDNMVGDQPRTHINGLTTVPSSDGGWKSDYSAIRKINIMLVDGRENLSEANYDDAITFLAEGHFFRAYTYFGLLKRYGDVPIIKQPLYPDDEELLKKPRNTRYEVAKFILEDLDFAIENMNEIDAGTRLSKEAAAAFKARFCLFEGTWEKYHKEEDTPFKAVRGDGTVSDGSEFLQEAIEAAEIVMNSGKFSLYNETDMPYFNCFNRQDQSENPEVIMFRHMLKERGDLIQNVSNFLYRATSNDWGQVGVTKDLVEAYIDVEGKPLSQSSFNYDDNTLEGVFENRDPRLKQLLYYPGFMVYEGQESLEYPEVPNLDNCPTGYHLKKGASQIYDNHINFNEDETDYIIFRYGEVLLNYIEAKAELDISSVTQADLDKTVNALRDRGGLPATAHLTLGNVPQDNQNVFYQNGIAPLLVEIRRERRIELACEGFRLDDLFRWAAVEEVLLGKKTFYGAKYDWWVQTSNDYNDGDFPVNSEGYLDPWEEFDGYTGFNSNRDYLYPLGTEEIGLAGYEQNPGWEE
jgi:hypothetical protein